MAFPGAQIPDEEPFETLLSAPSCDINRVRELAFCGISDKHRAMIWRILLDYLPLKRANREAELARKREQYRVFFREVTVKPGEDDEEEAAAGEASGKAGGSDGEGSSSSSSSSTAALKSGVAPLPILSVVSPVAGEKKKAKNADGDDAGEDEEEDGQQRSKLAKYSSLFGSSGGGGSSAVESSTGSSVTSTTTRSRRTSEAPPSANKLAAPKPLFASSIFADSATSSDEENDDGDEGTKKKKTNGDDDDEAENDGEERTDGLGALRSRALKSSLFGGGNNSNASSAGSSAEGSSGAAGGGGGGVAGGLTLFGGGRVSIFALPSSTTNAASASASTAAAAASTVPPGSDVKAASATPLSLALTSVSDDPLSVRKGVKNSKWAEWHKDEELRAEIEKDVLRTSPGLHFFANPCNLAAMSRILFVYAKLNSGVRYVQGMNELLAPIWLVMASEEEQNRIQKRKKERAESEAAIAAAESPSSSSSSAAPLSVSVAEGDDPLSSASAPGGGPNHNPLRRSSSIDDIEPAPSDPSMIRDAEADAFFCFMALMSEVRDVFIKAHDNSATGVKGMLARYSAILGRREPALSQHLARLRLDHQFYAFRWLTTLLSREFSMPDVLMLWDSLLADPYRFSYLLHTCVGMMRLQRSVLLSSDFGGCMKLLQHYPEETDFSKLMFAACQVRDEEACFFAEKEAQMLAAQQAQANKDKPAQAPPPPLLRSPSTSTNSSTNSSSSSSSSSASNASSGAGAAPRAPSLMRIESLQQQQQQKEKEKEAAASGFSSSSLHHTAFASAGLVSPGASEPLNRTMAREEGITAPPPPPALPPASSPTTVGAPGAPPSSFRTATGFEGSLSAAAAAAATTTAGAPPAKSPFSRLHGHPAFSSPFADERWDAPAGFGPDGDDYEEEEEDDEDGDGFGEGGVPRGATPLGLQQPALQARVRRHTSRRSKYYAFGANASDGLSSASSVSSTGSGAPLRSLGSSGGGFAGAGAGGGHASTGSGGGSSMASNGNAGAINLSTLVKTVSAAFTVTDPLADFRRNQQELKPVAHTHSGAAVTKGPL